MSSWRNAFWMDAMSIIGGVPWLRGPVRSVRVRCRAFADRVRHRQTNGHPITAQLAVPYNAHVDENAFDLPLTDPRHPFHVEHMTMALDEAAEAAAEDEVPVGAVIVSLKQGMLARAHNQRERLHDPTAHAEMIA